MEKNLVWCVCKMMVQAENFERITECESKESALYEAGSRKEEALKEDNVVRYFVALLNKTDDGYERDEKNPNSLKFYETIDVLKEK